MLQDHLGITAAFVGGAFVFLFVWAWKRVWRLADRTAVLEQHEGRMDERVRTVEREIGERRKEAKRIFDKLDENTAQIASIDGKLDILVECHNKRISGNGD